jgi:apolipoprotein N-acyltransferase
MGLAYVLFNLAFALLYWLQDGSIARAPSGSFADAFFFSVQTMATIGYGEMHPATLYANLLVTVEVLVGLLAVLNLLAGGGWRPAAVLAGATAAALLTHYWSFYLLAVAVAGLVVNLIAAWVLSRGGHSSVNLRAAAAHVLADAAGSVAAIAAALLILVPAAAGAVRLQLLPSGSTGIWLRLVQPSISEKLKWDPAAAEQNLERLMKLSAAPSNHALAAILWPEAAVPFLLERDDARRSAIAAILPKNGYLVTGALRANPPPATVTQVWNSVEAVDAQGAIRATYDKAHLVPFGEYVPFRDVLPMKKITPGAIDISAGPGPRSLSLPGLPSFSPIVCYEVIFPEAVVDRGARPDWILNVTNDVWYGHSSGPYQHFAIARTRAVEQGLPLVRAANNGISGVVDATGRILAGMDLDTIGYIDVVLPAPAAATPYAVAGDWIFLAMLLLALVPAAARLR